MTSDLRPVTSDPSDCRLIVDRAAPGSWNMAVDEALLADAVENGTATLRLYEWSEATLSLGYFQRHDDRFGHAASRESAIVRRQSGGGAILHDRELTYSLALPASQRLAHDAEQVYTAMHVAFLVAIARHVVAAAEGWTLRLRTQNGGRPVESEPFLCFQRRAVGDLLLVPPGNPPPAGEISAGIKILGSAQRRRQGAILQHGSLLLATSPAAPELPGVNDLTGTRLDPAQVTTSFLAQAGLLLQFRFEEARLPDNLQHRAGEIESRKYAAAGWTKRR